jgi:hypothetical protein
MANKRVLDPSIGKKENTVFLQPTNADVSIERTFRNVSSRDERWGYYVIVRLGRLNVQNSRYSLRFTAEIGEITIVSPWVGNVVPGTSDRY